MTDDLDLTDDIEGYLAVLKEATGLLTGVVDALHETRRAIDDENVGEDLVRSADGVAVAWGSAQLAVSQLRDVLRGLYERPVPYKPVGDFDPPARLAVPLTVTMPTPGYL